MNKMFSYVRKFLLSRKCYFCIRLVLGSIFIYAGFVKIIDPKSFAGVVSQYDLVPEAILPIVAIGLPVLELLSGMGLMFNVRGSLIVIFSLLLIFCGVLGFGILNSLHINCGCFTPEEIAGQASLKLALYRDFIMIAASLYIYLYQRSVSSMKSALQKPNKYEEERNVL